ncbi:MAG: hypothetical protein LBT66_07975 [Methanobrevibacter sp.]|jgi:hypothetical protein|nr:hypothetical protein [Candidatus Methanovirga meridionalis]
MSFGIGFLLLAAVNSVLHLTGFNMFDPVNLVILFVISVVLVFVRMYIFK